MNQLLRQIPKVDELLRCAALAEAVTEYGESPVTGAIRAELDVLRKGILSGTVSGVPDRETLCRGIRSRVQKDAQPRFRRVINGTGVILHTNLGRACLSEKAARAVYDASVGYTNLEYDLETGKRGSRYSHVEDILCRLTGAESALVVNNNAAAVLLPMLETAEGDIKTGIKIVLRALEEPVRQIAANSGLEGSVIIDKIRTADKVNFGFNFATEEYVDMFAAGIVDPTKVTRSALQNAASVAAMVLTTESLVADKKEPVAPAPAPAGGMDGMY